MWRDGIFPKDPDLKQFLTSGPAILAALQIQNAFEMKYGKDECERLIEDYAYWGGDHGFTEQTMREACGMPPRDVRDVATRAASVIVLDSEPPPADDPDVVWRKVSDTLMNHLLIQRRLDLTAPMLKKLKFKNVPNLSKEHLIDTMKENKMLIQSHSRGKSETVFALGITTGVKLQSLIAYTDRTSCPDLEESLATAAFSTYVEAPSRADNAQLLALVYKNIARKTGVAGRPTAAAKARKEKYAEKAQKMLDHERMCLSLLKELTGPQVVSSQQSPARKRFRTKSREIKQEASRVKDEIVDDDARRKLRTVESSYEYPNTTMLRTRKIVQGIRAQKFTRRAQQHLLSHTHDLDIANSVFTVISQLLDKLKPVPPLPQDLRVAFDRCVSHRDQVIREELKTSREKGKQILAAILCGGAIPEDLAGNEFLICISKVSLYVRWLSMSLLEDEFHRFRSPAVNKKNPDMSILAHLYQAAEDYILSEWVIFLQTLKPTHVSLHFDGVRVALPHDMDTQELCDLSQKHIETKTGFQVHIREKRHRSVLQLIKSSSEQEPAMGTGESLLEKDGNCIPAAIASLLGNRALVEQAVDAESEAATIRSYKQCEKLCKVKLIPYVQVSELDAGIFLVHSEGLGVPHCVGLRIDQDDGACVVYDTDGAYKQSRSAFEQAVDAGTDSSTCVYFRVLDESVDPVPFCSDELDDEDVASLLNLEASGHKRPASIQEPPQAPHQARSSLQQPSVYVPSSESGDEVAVVDIPSDTASTGAVEGDDPPDDGEPGCNRWVEDGAVVITDSVLLGSLAKEVSDHIRQGQFVQVMNKYSCPLCPWRSFQSPSRVKEHLSKYHVAKKQYCCSGTKQLKCVLSLHDSDMIAGTRHGKYLQRSAQVLREQVQPPLPSSVNWIDKSIRLVLDSTGPRYVNVTVLGHSLVARRVGNIYYTRPFAEQLFQEIVLHHAKAREFRTYSITPVMLLGLAH